jgi:hypothetical protein
MFAELAYRAGFTRKFRNQMRWNEFAKLSENSQCGCDLVFLFSPLSSDKVKEPCQPLVFRVSTDIPMGWL